VADARVADLHEHLVWAGGADRDLLEDGRWGFVLSAGAEREREREREREAEREREREEEGRMEGRTHGRPLSQPPEPIAPPGW
jgi:hypothetical protein